MQTSKVCLFILIILLAACSNPKADIVNQQQDIQRKIGFYKTQQKIEELRIEQITKDTSEDIKQYPQLLESAIEMNISISKIAGKLRELNDTEDSLQQIFDSLQFELKKY